MDTETERHTQERVCKHQGRDWTDCKSHQKLDVEERCFSRIFRGSMALPIIKITNVIIADTIKYTYTCMSITKVFTKKLCNIQVFGLDCDVFGKWEKIDLIPIYISTYLKF